MLATHRFGIGVARKRTANRPVLELFPSNSRTVSPGVRCAIVGLVALGLMMGGYLIGSGSIGTGNVIVDSGKSLGLVNASIDRRDGLISVDGFLRNDCTNTVDNPIVEATLFDRAGHVIGLEQSLLNAKALRTGQGAAFHIDLEDKHGVSACGLRLLSLYP